MRENQFVARVNYACPVCGKVDEEQSAILIHKRLSDISHLDNKTAGFGEPCSECKEMMAQGIVFCICDESKSETNDPYRLGQLFVINEEKCKEMVNPDFWKILSKSRFAMIDWKLAQQLGIPAKPPVKK